MNAVLLAAIGTIVATSQQTTGTARRLVRLTAPPAADGGERWHPIGQVALVLGGIALVTVGILLGAQLFHTVTAAAWPYLLVVLPVALRWGWRPGMLTAVVAGLVLLGVPTFEPSWQVTRQSLPDYGRLLVSLAGMAGAAVLIDRVNQGRIAAERRAAQGEERARLLAVEQQARAEAEAALRTRDQFLSVLSHDLQTPVTVIKGHVQLLQRQLAAAETPRFAGELTTIDDAATTLSSMIGDVLDLARLQTGRPPSLQREPTDVVALILQLTAHLCPEGSGHRLVVETTADILVGMWDRSRLERVLANLLSNALKYSPAGGTVMVRVHRETAAPDGRTWAVLSVADQGVGIPAADIPQLFTPFQRGSNVVDRIPGTGIGLAGAKQSVEQLGGMLTVESTEGVGSTFTVRLPLS